MTSLIHASLGGVSHGTRVRIFLFQEVTSGSADSLDAAVLWTQKQIRQTNADAAKPVRQGQAPRSLQPVM
ncbi:hypothetical protein MIZ03_4277 [Rhodoferax lithotrophicus]|jgi:hypothetical protein|uniref:Uncharacterized protein n=1 Tax=Rhodoferax lithotrophicus TaxID=2798804 RepID=A0ABN6DBG1_9BURK|nr:hypothetical protein [Rhodoferax sp. MIZ03]BCO29354.1 hypothetical protein MIZ03_4277 [Rhodoferax sp. MIZ03]